LSIKIAVDAMGGDLAPAVVLEGIYRTLQNPANEEVTYLLFGQEEQVRPLLDKYAGAFNKLTFHHCSEIVTGVTEPRLAIRGLKDSSMRKAIEAVAEGAADGVVSAGNTGAYMALSKLILKPLEGIHRPAITATFPTTQSSPLVFLDLGANTDVSPEVLVQFCLMGQAFAKCMLGKQSPSVALLNVGSEELKGNTMVREAQNLIHETALIKNYVGYVEGDDIFKGKVDVIVTDGFTGNVALKAIEGTVNFFSHLMKEEMLKRWRTRLGGFLARPALSAFKARIDPRAYNGAPFLGLRGISVKSHGGTDAYGFACALQVAINLVRHRVNDRIQQEVSLLQKKLDVLP
jgi:glycerol-3-phosphate acyltransferase PlsX